MRQPNDSTSTTQQQAGNYFMHAFLVIVVRTSHLILRHFDAIISLISNSRFLFVDDVVKALEQGMKPNNDDQTKSTEKNGIHRQGMKGLVVNDEAWLKNQPKESVLLFPGASVSISHEPESHQTLVVHCDECQNQIEGSIFCCKTCFDYDLCSTCFPKASLTHANGKHEFLEES